jgi:hypothetical protein
MKLATKPNTVSVPSADPLLTGAKAHFEAAADALRKGCAEALITGMHLIALHSRTAGNGHGGNRITGASVPHGTLEKGFRGACDVIGIPERTAYRWMNACKNAAVRATLVFEGDDISAELPDHGDTAKWELWEQNMREIAAGMSLSRLLLGTMKASTEEHRYDELLSADEEGRNRATELLQSVAEGRYTLAQAVKALGSQEAYDKLRQSGSEKIRKDPVYLDFDPIAKRSVGLIPKAFTTLHNGFQQWDSYDADARHEMRRQWVEVIKTAPRELTDALRK